MAAILDFTHNEMTNVRSGHTPMSDILENEIMIVPLLYKKMISIYCFTVHKWRPS